MQRRLRASRSREGRGGRTAALPSVNRSRFADVAIWPGCGLAKATRSSKESATAPSASSVSAATASAASVRRIASASARQPIAVVCSVPLISAMPSRPTTAGRAMPARSSAVPPSTIRPAWSARPAPINGRAICANGAKSPQAPTDPCSGTTGTTPRLSMATSASRVSRRTPVQPVASTLARISIIARTASAGIAGPTPAAWLLSRLCCWARLPSGDTGRPSSAPKPVVTP